MRRYALKLVCGHVRDEVSVTEYQGKPYFPDYRNRLVECRHPGCRKLSKVVSQDPLPPDSGETPEKAAFYKLMGV